MRFWLAPPPSREFEKWGAGKEGRAKVETRRKETGIDRGTAQEGRETLMEEITE